MCCFLTRNASYAKTSGTAFALRNLAGSQNPKAERACGRHLSCLIWLAVCFAFAQFPAPRNAIASLLRLLLERRDPLSTHVPSGVIIVVGSISKLCSTIACLRRPLASANCMQIEGHMRRDNAEAPVQGRVWPHQSKSRARDGRSCAKSLEKTSASQ